MSVPRRRRVIMIVPDTPLRELLGGALEREHFESITVETAEEALRLAGTLRPDVIVADLNINHEDRENLARHLKSDPQTSYIPLMMLSEKQDDVSEANHLEKGADDYIQKPVSPRVFVARVRAVVRSRRESVDSDEQMLTFGDLQIRPKQHKVFVSGEQVRLTATEFKILVTLASRPGWIFSREEIVEASRGKTSLPSTRSVDVNIVRLRSKIKPLGHMIETVRQIGYRFSDPARQTKSATKPA